MSLTSLLFSAVLSVTVLASPVLAKEKVFCFDGKDRPSALTKKGEWDALIRLGYSPKSEFIKKQNVTYVGSGLLLMDDELGVLVTGAVPDSPAAKTEMFPEGKWYIIRAVNGVPTDYMGIEAVRTLILGSGKPGTGVVITITSARPGRRDFVRFLTRERLHATIEIPCVRLATPPEK